MAFQGLVYTTSLQFWNPSTAPTTVNIVSKYPLSCNKQQHYNRDKFQQQILIIANPAFTNTGQILEKYWKNKYYTYE